MNSSSSFSSSNTHFCFDAKTQKLLELTKSKDIQEKKVEEIISILNLKCPKLLEGLCKRRTRNVVSQLQFKCFPRDEVIFHQNDEPDAYYTVIRGAVSIYAQNSTALDENNTTCSSSLSHKEENLGHRSKYGKFLVQLPPGSGFGELSFNADGKHSKRSAGVVSDGSHGQSKVYSDDNREHEASDVAVLLLIPGTVYLKEMFGRDINKHQTKEKVDFLKSSFIFSVWSVDQLVFLSHEMRKLEYSSGSKIVNQGEKNENTWIIKNGTVQIFVEVERRRQLRPSNADKYLVNIATLSANDLFGIVEALEGSTKMRCSVKALSDVEVFVISSKALISFLPQVPRTRLMLQKVARNRVSWEELRIDFARKFPNIKLCLTPKFQKTLSDYHLSQEMALTDTEIKQRKKRSLVLFKCLRDARASYRMYLKTREDHPTRFVQKVLQKAEAFCMEAIKISAEIDDSQRYLLAQDLHAKIISELYGKGEATSVRIKSIKSKDEVEFVNSKILFTEKHNLDSCSTSTDNESEYDVTPSNRAVLLDVLATKAGINLGEEQV